MNQLDIINSFHFIYFCRKIIPILLVVFVIIKTFLLHKIYLRWQQLAMNNSFFVLLSIPIFSYVFGELSNITIFFDHSILHWTMARIAWNMQPIQFYAQILFVQNLMNLKVSLQKRDKKILLSLFLFTFLPLFLLFNPNEAGISGLFLSIFCKAGITKRIIFKIAGYFFLIRTIYALLKEASVSQKLPYFLILQLKRFFVLMCLPLFSDCLDIVIGLLQLQHESIFNILRFLDLFSIGSFTISLLFFTRRIYHLRFLNMTERVVAGLASQLTEEQVIDTKQTLCEAKNTERLSQIHTDFFKQLANIAPERIIFHLRTSEKQVKGDEITKKIEQFIQEKPNIASQFFIEDSLLVYDELAFTHFYEYSDASAELLQFLQEINAAVMIPLKHMDQFFGVIIITKDPKKEELFSKSVQIHMQLYGTFVTYALSRLEHVSYYTLLEKHKALSLALFQTNQKNARFHEIVMSFLKSDATKKHGIVLYKNSVFSCINEIAESLLQINLNTHQGHPLVKALKELVRRVQTYGGSEKIIEKNNAGLDLCFQAFLSQKEELFILISRADVTHLLSVDQALLQPTEIDYAVFLYTTPEGHAVNNALPGKGNMMHQAKVRMLKTLLSKQVMLLDAHEDDFDMIFDVAKKVRHKTTVQTIDCRTMSLDAIATALFGTTLLIDASKKFEHGLLYALDGSGIIHIANAHQLDSNIQQLLVRFLKTGTFCLYKTEMRQTSDVTIMFSSPTDLSELAKNNLFSKELYEYIQDAVIAVPNLLHLPFAEVETLAKELQKQLIRDPEYYHLFGFSAKELEELHNNRPESYTQLRRRITALTKQHKAQLIVQQEAAVQNVTIGHHDELLLDAARRGKQVLKDRKTMRALWERFKNQTRIAELLDVDRSSVHRRLKSYGVVVTVE